MALQPQVFRFKPHVACTLKSSSNDIRYILKPYIENMFPNENRFFDLANKLRVTNLSQNTFKVFKNTTTTKRQLLLDA